MTICCEILDSLQRWCTCNLSAKAHTSHMNQQAQISSFHFLISVCLDNWIHPWTWEAHHNFIWIIDQPSFLSLNILWLFSLALIYNPVYRTCSRLSYGKSKSFSATLNWWGCWPEQWIFHILKYALSRFLTCICKCMEKLNICSSKSKIEHLFLKIKSMVAAKIKALFTLTQRSVSNRGQVRRTAFNLFVRDWSFALFNARETES